MRYDVVIAGGGHNGLVAAAYLARAGRRVLVLERLDHIGGLAISAKAFPGVDARLSRYSYLVSLLPTKIVKDLGLSLELRRRRVASYTPAGDTGLLIDNEDPARTAASFTRAGSSDLDAWNDFHATLSRLAARVAPTLLEPLPSRTALRKTIDDDTAWHDLFERPIGQVIDDRFGSDLIRGIVLTDALTGTFANPHEDLLANRCFLYHVIGNGSGEWTVPVGGMGAVSDAIAEAARAAGAKIMTGCEVLHIDPNGEVTYTENGSQHVVTADRVLVNMPPKAHQEGSQLKLNMVLSRLPRLKDPHVDPRTAFTGTFRVNESASQLSTAFDQASRGLIPDLPPSEIYCHSLTDDSIFGPSLRESGAQTLTLFGLCMPARLFTTPEAKDLAVTRTLASINTVLAEPIENCLLTTPDGQPCLEAKTPLDLERDVALPGGHIFHGDLSWPYAEDDHDPWGVETAHPRILRCGASARRGGGVSGIPGHNAAMAALG
ncbi:NAD(P)/FAD-dependent oxidoreductase [Acrocarpospora macrocephala]|uniref:Pyridine nucleotide-disulfide oxidoreductase domain-containing protein 2 n=1 Tax=Acrocarpospora macrocephala TaxID=150177 RepID=A0A5M3WK78_9ACTN|nr:NAD(P)/FAD-dependent oxidoreductase [Acrocarpospora macrocephala]GES07601.1 oxidoreductase [Acrocarpospora macrocephala]